MSVHRAIWGEDRGDDYAPPADKPLTRVAYVAGAPAEAFVEFSTVGGTLPDMPLFLTAEAYVLVPLQRSYEPALDAMPAYWKKTLDNAVRHE